MRQVLLVWFLFFLTACAGTPERPSPGAQAGAGPDFRLIPVRFPDIPGWSEADHAPAFAAFRRQCASWAGKPADGELAGGAYARALETWAPACALSGLVSPGAERAFFEALFTPARVTGGGEIKLTGYYEPVIEARRAPDSVFSEPLLKPPADMVQVDLAQFARALGEDGLAGGRTTLTGRLAGGRIVPYPQRSEIRSVPGAPIAFARPADVYNLQVQGSGRLRFENGEETRAAFAAQNGHRWRSALSGLVRAGRIPAASWSAFRSYLERRPDLAQETLNADPSYVFFAEEAVADPGSGPRGAAGVALTAMGSLAVDPRWHPYGAVIFLDGVHGETPFRRLLVAQDTGGAIRRGPMRGDVFFGTGAEAGRQAERMNAAAAWWTLLPKTLAPPDGPGERPAGPGA